MDLPLSCYLPFISDKNPCASSSFSVSVLCNVCVVCFVLIVAGRKLTGLASHEQRSDGELVLGFSQSLGKNWIHMTCPTKRQKLIIKQTQTEYLHVNLSLLFKIFQNCIKRSILGDKLFRSFTFSANFISSSFPVWAVWLVHRLLVH